MSHRFSALVTLSVAKDFLSRIIQPLAIYLRKMPDHSRSEEERALLVVLSEGGLEVIFRKSFSPEVAGVYGRLVNDSDIQISDELQMTIELIELLDGGAVISGV